MNEVISYRKTIQEYQDSSRPKCSILLSTYNGEKYIEEQIKSIISQRDVDISLIIRDDGSTDNTLGILREYKERFINIIEVVSGKNVGIHESFKQLMESVGTHSYIAFSDQDDVWDDDKIITAINAMRYHNADFYSCSARLVDQDNRPLNRDTANILEFQHYMNGENIILSPGVQGCTMVITHSLFDTLVQRGIPNEYGHDTWIPIVSYYISTCLYDSTPHMNYRQHDRSWTGNRANRIRQMLTETKFFLQGLKRYRPLAAKILEKYNDLLFEDDRKVLSSFSEKTGFIQKIKTINEYKIEKYGCVKNLIFRLYYLL